MPQQPTPTDRQLMARLDRLEQLARDNAHNQQKIWTTNDPTQGGDWRLAQPVQGAVAVAGYLTPICQIDGVTGFGIAVFDPSLGGDGEWCLVQCAMPPGGDTLCGTAFYENNDALTIGPVTAWTPDFTDDVMEMVAPPTAGGGIGDSIGCTPQTPGGGFTSFLQIPYGWMWWATITYYVKTAAPPPTGEFMIGSPHNMGFLVDALDQGMRQAIACPLYDTSGDDAPAQAITATVHGSAGELPPVGPEPIFGPGGDGIFPDTISTVLGTEFIPEGLSIIVQALSPFPCSTTGFVVE